MLSKTIKIKRVPSGERLIKRELSSFSTYGNPLVSNSEATMEKPYYSGKYCNKGYASVAVPKTLSSKPQWLLSEDERQEFFDYFPLIVQDLTQKTPYTDIPEVINRFVQVLEYNVPHGKKYRAQALIAAYKAFESAGNLTPENIRLINILAWGVELSQASLLVEDDLEDSSDTRHGVPAWHKVEGVGLQAIYDAQMLENGFFYILKKYFSDNQCYVPIMDLYTEIIMKTRLGQSLDCMPYQNQKPRFDLFTMKTFSTIARHKTSYQGFVLPITVAMYFAGKYNTEVHDQVTRVLLEMGEFYQIENDVLDCFGDPGVTGKYGNDITEGKCTWLVTEALQRATPHQKQMLMENYGKPSIESERIVRNLYTALNLIDAYALYKENSFDRITTYINQMRKGIPREFFYKFLKQVYKRH